MLMTPTLPRRPRWRSLALLALCLAPLLWPLEHLAERYYRSELASQNRQTLDLYVANLLGTLHRYEVLPQILGDLPALRAVLGAPDDGVTQGNANRLLKNISAQTGAEVMYLMDTTGKTLAASNWDKHDSFVGRNFAFRPYFSEAMAGRLGRFFGLGTTSAKRGYFFAVFAAGNTHNLHVQHSGHAQQEFFHFAGVDVFATANDHVLDAPGHPQVAVFIHNAKVAGMQPAIGADGLGRVVGHIVVTLHHIVATAQNFAHLTARQFLAGIGVAHAHLNAGHGAAHGFAAQRQRIVDV